jgi:hypothetical protein
MGLFRNFSADRINGAPRLVGDSNQISGVTVLFNDASGFALLATGTTVPTDNDAGFAKGCLFIDTDVAAGTTGLYVNVGTTAACNFDAITDAA